MKSFSVGALSALGLLFAPAALSAPPADKDMKEHRSCNRVTKWVDGAPPNLPTETPYRVRKGTNLEYGFYMRVDSCDKSRPSSWTLGEKGDAPTTQFYALKLLNGTRDDFVVRVGDEETNQYFIYSSAHNYRRVLWVIMDASGQEIVRRSGNRDQLLMSRIEEVHCGPGRRSGLPLNSDRPVAIDASACRPR